MRKSFINRALMMGVLCLGLATAGCGAKSSSSDAAAPNQETQESTTEETTTEEETTEPETTEAETSEMDVLTTGADWFDLGSVTDGVYTNEQSGLTVIVPEDWMIFTKEQLGQIGMEGYELLSDEQKVQFDLVKNKTKYAYAATGPDGSSIMFVAENMAASVMTMNVNEEGYISVLKQQMGAGNIPYEFGEVTEFEAAGRTWKALPCYAAGMTQYYLLHKIDGRMESFIISTGDEEKISELVACIDGL